MTTDDTPRPDRRPVATGALRSAWRARSLAEGWAATDDWWTDAVDTVALAACRGTDLTRGCHLLGRARARAGVGISEALADLAALYAVLGPSTPPIDVICALAEGWADAGLAELAAGHCEDPLTGLVTLPYLRTRLREVYREAKQRATCPSDTHRLVVVDLPRLSDPWRRIALAIGVGRDLKAVFPGGETLSLGRPGPAIALVQAGADLRFQFARLRRAIRTASGADVQLLRLPARQEDAERLLDGLAH